MTTSSQGNTHEQEQESLRRAWCPDCGLTGTYEVVRDHLCPEGDCPLWCTCDNEET